MSGLKNVNCFLSWNKALSNEQLSKVGVAFNKLHGNPVGDIYEDDFWS